jgi:hypothetical protein
VPACTGTTLEKQEPHYCKHLITTLENSRLHNGLSKKFDWGILITLLVFGAINVLISQEAFILAVIAAMLCTISLDRFVFYKSAVNILLPFILLVIIGLFSGIEKSRLDYYRDVFIFSRNIIYFISGITLSRYVKSIQQFFSLFIIVGFIASLIHLAKIILHLGEIDSLQSIREIAGFSNSVEAIVLSLYVSRLLSRRFKAITGRLTIIQKLMLLVTALSFFLYFSRTLLILLPVICLFLTDSIYIRKIFSKKNKRVLNTAVIFAILLSIVYFVSLLFPEDSPVHTLVQKFQNIPQEISWDKERNLHATREEIQNNWRGYESYQGMLKFNDGQPLQRIFGYGFGEMVDLGLIMKLAGRDYEKVPILHNEYVMLLVKTGIAGLLLYLIFLYRLAFTKLTAAETDDPELYYSYQLISAMSVVMFLNTYIGFGLLDPSNQAIAIFLGFFWGNIQRNKIRR